MLNLHQIRYTTPIYRRHSRGRPGERLGSGNARDPNPATSWLVVPIISNFFQVIEAGMWERNTALTARERRLTLWIDHLNSTVDESVTGERRPLDKPANSVVTKPRSRQI